MKLYFNNWCNDNVHSMKEEKKKVGNNIFPLGWTHIYFFLIIIKKIDEYLVEY